MTKDSRADVRQTPTLSTTLDAHTDLGRNAARTRLSGCSQLTTLPPLSSSFVSDGVVFGRRWNLVRMNDTSSATASHNDALVARLLVAVIVLVHPKRLLAERADEKKGH
ncbi:hypothetical protein BLNAU_9271 [Blattamonas nauphoetae]|uniref:Uncharacterized protein n=1 Tax=Blattamonas nauphoetae TaxID=2049346 RepID=A0ABQ9XW79_9EUKA|nr:hypothetical protein BLNAU_9271 [Blattamonas nauphoetae]